MIKPIVLCPFLPRCRVTVADCQRTMPPSRHIGGDHYASCVADLTSHWSGDRA
jgi:hypothetical protein